MYTLYVWTRGQPRKIAWSNVTGHGYGMSIKVAQLMNVAYFVCSFCSVSAVNCHDRRRLQS